MASKKAVYCLGLAGGLIAVYAGCSSQEVKANPHYKWVYESSGIGRIVEESASDKSVGIENAVLSSEKPVVVQDASMNPYYNSTYNAASGLLFGTAGLCFAMAIALKYRQFRKNMCVNIVSNKKKGMPKINLLPPEFRGGRIKKAIRYLYKKIPKRKEPDYPMPGYDKKGWENYGN